MFMCFGTMYTKELIRGYCNMIYVLHTNYEIQPCHAIQSLGSKGINFIWPEFKGIILHFQGLSSSFCIYVRFTSICTFQCIRSLLKLNE